MIELPKPMLWRQAATGSWHIMPEPGSPLGLCGYALGPGVPSTSTRGREDKIGRCCFACAREWGLRDVPRIWDNDGRTERCRVLVEGMRCGAQKHAGKTHWVLIESKFLPGRDTPDPDWNR